MPPKDNSERACEECIHYWACSRQCGEPMAQSSATGCECYETVKSSMAYYVGTLDGAKVKIPNRLRELVEADKDGRCVVLPCKVGDIVYKLITIKAQKPVILETQIKTLGQAADVAQLIGKRNKVINVFLTREEAERALQEMESRKDG